MDAHARRYRLPLIGVVRVGVFCHLGPGEDRDALDGQTNGKKRGEEGQLLWRWCLIGSTHIEGETGVKTCKREWRKSVLGRSRGFFAVST